MCPCPFARKLRCSQKLLVCVLSVDVLVSEGRRCDDLGQDPGAGDELDLGESRVENETVRL